MPLLNVLNPVKNTGAFSELVRMLIQRRVLVLEMARREISERYAGQMFGALWAIGHPLFMIGLYVFVFAFVFKTKVGGTHDLPLDYTAYLLSGLIPWMAFQESMAKGSVAITANASLVKQVVFPLEVLVAKGVAACFVNMGISLLILITYVLFSHGSLPWTYVLLPLLVVMQLAAMLGLAMLLSSVGVFFRDMKDMVQLFAVAGVYLLPVFYLPAWVPPLFKPVIYLNPFSYMIWCYQDALYYGRFEHPWAWLVFGLGSVAIFILGYRVFRRLKPTFGNAL